MANKNIKIQKKESIDEITESIRIKSQRNIWVWMEKWSQAISIAFTPKIVVLLIMWIIFFRSTTSAFGDMRTYLEIIVMVVSSLITAVFVQDWIEARGNTILEKKSTTSIRYLQALKYKIQNVSGRINILDDKKDYRFAEILNLIGNIDKDILNSISDWADINPASTAIVDYFEELRVNEEMIKQLKSDKLDLEDQKEKLKNVKTDEIGKLEGEIAKKESKIYELQRKISEQSLNNSGIASGTYPLGYGYSGVSLASSGAGSRCKRCGGMMGAIDSYDANVYTAGLCSNCKSNIVNYN